MRFWNRSYVAQLCFAWNENLVGQKLTKVYRRCLFCWLLLTLKLRDIENSGRPLDMMDVSCNCMVLIFFWLFSKGSLVSYRKKTIILVLLFFYHCMLYFFNLKKDLYHCIQLRHPNMAPKRDFHQCVYPTPTFLWKKALFWFLSMIKVKFYS